MFVSSTTHVPAGGPGGHDDPRSQHRVPLVRPRAGRVAAEIVASGMADVIYGVGASVWGYAERGEPARARRWCSIPQGLEEFGGIDGGDGGRP